LARPLQDLVTLVDQLNDKTRRMSAKGINPSEDFIKQRKEIRRLTGEIIHPTGHGNASEGVGKILLMGETLNKSDR
jgi:hypothetical protein